MEEPRSPRRLQGRVGAGLPSPPSPPSPAFALPGGRASPAAGPFLQVSGGERGGDPAPRRATAALRCEERGEGRAPASPQLPVGPGRAGGAERAAFVAVRGLATRGGGRPAAPGARLREGTPELGATGPSKGGREAKFVGSEGVRGLSRRIWDAALVTDAEKPINRRRGERRGEQRGGVDVLEVPRR